MSRRGLLVYNPKAGARDRRAEMRAVVERSRAAGLELVELPTERAGHATELVRSRLAEGPDLVVAGGGDGTLAEVARAHEELARHGTAVAVLPLGTANVVAREYGVGVDPERAERLFASPRRQRLTLWRAGDRASLIGVGVGFDARVMANTIPLLKRLFGRAGIGVTATLEWLKYEFPALKVTGKDADGAAFERDATFVLSANTRRYGGDAILSPTADPQDELLDLVLVSFTSTPALLRFYGRLSRGRAEHLAMPAVSCLSVRSFEVTSGAGYPVEVQVDGDGAGVTPIAVSPLGSLQIVIP